MVKKTTDTPAKAKATKKTTKTPVQEAAPAPAPAPVEETNAVVEESTEKSLADDFGVFMSHLQAVASSLSNLKTNSVFLKRKLFVSLKLPKKPAL